jgi:hypothetical protein
VEGVGGYLGYAGLSSLESRLLSLGDLEEGNHCEGTRSVGVTSCIDGACSCIELALNSSLETWWNAPLPLQQQEPIGVKEKEKEMEAGHNGGNLIPEQKCRVSQHRTRRREVPLEYARVSLSSPLSKVLRRPSESILLDCR